MLLRWTSCTVCAAILTVSLGCGQKSKFKTVPVEGTVTYNGNAVKGAMVAFHPAVAGSGKSALGTTDASGKFSLQTPEGSKTAPGALVGDYVIAITLEKPVDMMAGAMPGAATDGSNVNLMMDMENKTDEEKRKLMGGAGGVTTPTDGKSPLPEGPKPADTTVLPAKYADPKTSELKETIPAGGKKDCLFALTD